jgi:hypothetical protein
MAAGRREKSGVIGEVAGFAEKAGDVHSTRAQSRLSDWQLDAFTGPVVDYRQSMVFQERFLPQHL